MGNSDEEAAGAIVLIGCRGIDPGRGCVVQHVCKYACSEEVPEPVDMGGEGFSVAFDPLDGSSIVDTNFTVSPRLPRCPTLYPAPPVAPCYAIPCHTAAHAPDVGLSASLPGKPFRFVLRSLVNSCWLETVMLPSTMEWTYSTPNRGMCSDATDSAKHRGAIEGLSMERAWRCVKGIDSNVKCGSVSLQVGTIFGVWPGDKLKGITGRDQAAAGMGVFGPRTCYVIALKDAPGCHEFLLQVTDPRPL